VLEKGSDKEELFTILQGEALVVGQSKKGSLPFWPWAKRTCSGSCPSWIPVTSPAVPQ